MRSWSAGVDSKQHFITVITYVVVSDKDPAFADPTKPIGPVYTRAQAAQCPFATRRTAKGYRRVAASPEPLTVVEKREIRRLIDMDFIVICCGGGGIPVIREGRPLQRGGCSHRQGPGQRPAGRKRSMWTGF